MIKYLRFLILLGGLSASLWLPMLEKRFGVQRSYQKFVETLIKQGGQEADNLLSLSGKGWGPSIDGRRGPAVKAAFVTSASLRSVNSEFLNASAKPFYARPLFLDTEDEALVSPSRAGNWTLLTPKEENGAIDIDLPLQHADGWLYLSQAYRPSWSAHADGNPRRVLRAERAFVAMHVHAEDKRVHLVSLPLAFYVGLTISLLSLVFIFLEKSIFVLLRYE